MRFSTERNGSRHVFPHRQGGRLVLVWAALFVTFGVAAQDQVSQTNPGISTEPPSQRPDTVNPDVGAATVDIYGAEGAAGPLLHVPVSNLFPGNVKVKPPVDNPVADDPDSAFRGATYFNQFNCVGCHAPNGAGGMGPSLSNHAFIYGGEPENIYLSILQGRPAGMPAWGGMLPDTVIWDLVSYIESISHDDAGEWGKTTSLGHFSIEQVPAEYQAGVTPWKYTQPFSYGQKPFEKVDTPIKEGLQ